MDEQRYLDGVRRQFRSQKARGDRALAQIGDRDWTRTIGEETNPIAVVVKHVAGNMRSRWTDFLTTDGEKPDRHRDREFELEEGDDPASLRARWEAGWALVFAAVDGLTVEDLDRTVTLRGEPHTVVEAVQRQIDHYAHHVGQIVLLARHWAGPGWKSLSVPRGGSTAFNEQMARRFGR